MQFKKFPLYAAMIVAALAATSCSDDDDNNNSEEHKSTSEPTDFQKSISGTFVELFTDKGFTAPKYDGYWTECCAKYAGNEYAGSAVYQMLKTSMTGTLYGAEAQAKYGDGTDGFPNGYQFNCGFIGGVSKFVIDGKKITGLDAGSKTVFSHEYTQTGVGKDGQHFLKSDDANDDAFKYFLFWGDTPATTYHLEFRYGNDSAALYDYFKGAYAYWLAAAMLETETEANAKACIKLFCDENLADYQPTYVYATTDMTWSEFYAAELGKTASTLQDLGIDAVSSATNTKGAKFANALFEVDGDGSKLPGVKAVNVAIETFHYNALDDKSRFTVLDNAPEDFKIYNTDGSFGAWNSKIATQTVTATLASGFDAKWGNYVISLSGLDGVTTDNLQGAVLTTTDGSKYGLQFLNNLWLKPAEFTFCIAEFTEPHGCQRAYKQTADIEGKTLSNITYILKDTVNISADLDLYVKKQTTATVSAATAAAGTDVTITLNFSDVPADAAYTISSVKKGSGKGATALTADDYSYADGKLTLNGSTAADDVFTVSFSSDNYISIGTTITLE